jgi:hypothetical protein
MDTFLSTHTQTHMYIYIYTYTGIDSLVPKVIAQVVPEVNKRSAIPGLGWGGQDGPINQLELCGSKKQPIKSSFFIIFLSWLWDHISSGF